MKVAKKVASIAVVILILSLVSFGIFDYIENSPLNQQQSQLESATKVIYLSMRASRLDSTSGVLQISNILNAPIKAHVLVVNHDNQQATEFDANLGSQQMWEVGWTYGWDFKPNEEIMITVPGYAAASWITTKMDNGEVGIQPKP